MRLKLSDMSPALRERVEAAMARQGYAPGSRTTRPDAAGRTDTPPPAPERNGGGTPRNVRGPNKTEAEYNRLYLHGSGLYEGFTLRLPGGSRYTPDWVVFSDFKGQGLPVVELHEVKGSYRFGSQGRALTAFREAVAAFPCFVFVWAKRGKDGRWDIKRYGGANGVSPVPAQRKAVASVPVM